MKRSKLFAVVSIFLSASVGTAAVADGRRDIYFQEASRRYFNLPQNARTFGMGGSSVATSSDSSSIIGNPAGLGFMTEGELSGSYGYNRISGNEHPSYATIEDKISQGSALLAMPIEPAVDGLPELGNFGLGWNGNNTSFSDDTYGLESSGYQVHAAYAKAVSDDWSVGYGLSYFNDELKSDLFEYPMSNGFRHTLGVQGHLSQDLSLGSSFFVGHGTHDAKILADDSSTDSQLLEVGLDIGLGYQIAESTLISLSVDYQHYRSHGDLDVARDEIAVGGDERGNAFGAHLGVEQTLTDWLKARVGYRYQGNADYDFARENLNVLNGSAKFNAWSAGIGTVIPVGGEYIRSIKLDYGVEYRYLGYQDWEHLVTISVPFGVCREASS